MRRVLKTRQDEEGRNKGGERERKGRRRSIKGIRQVKEDEKIRLKRGKRTLGRMKEERVKERMGYRG